MVILDVKVKFLNLKTVTIYLLASFFLASCQTNFEQIITYCTFNSGKRNQEFLYLDKKEKLFRADDVSGILEVVENDNYIGVLSPFQFSLPKAESAMVSQMRWELEGTEFVLFPSNEKDGGWLTIQALRKGSPNISHQTTLVLYSYDKGVVMVRRKTTIDGIHMVSELILCSEQGLLLSDI